MTPVGNTQSAVVLESLISQFFYNKAAEQQRAGGGQGQTMSGGSSRRGPASRGWRWFAVSALLLSLMACASRPQAHPQDPLEPFNPWRLQVERRAGRRHRQTRGHRLPRPHTHPLAPGCR